MHWLEIPISAFFFQFPEEHQSVVRSSRVRSFLFLISLRFKLPDRFFIKAQENTKHGSEILWYKFSILGNLALDLQLMIKSLEKTQNDRFF